MVAPATEVTIVAHQPGDVVPHLHAALRREGLVLAERYGADWLQPRDAAPLAGNDQEPEPGRPAPREPGLYLWFPAAELHGELDRWSAALDGCQLRPGVLAVVEAAAVEDFLAAGVDDAVPRSISERELVARVRALHRRLARRAPEGKLRYGALTLDTMERSVWVDGTSIGITPIEQAVLVALIRAAGRALSRVALLDAAWGEGELEVSERAVDNVILRLRRKLPRPELIETVRGVGFRLAASAPYRRHAAS